jgi:hypothetical protein
MGKRVSVHHLLVWANQNKIKKLKKGRLWDEKA